MAEQQLVDYIKKAKDAGQSEDQTRALLYKNGWTVVEVDDTFASLVQAQQATIKPPEIKLQQPEAEAKPQPLMPRQPAIGSENIIDIEPIATKSQVQPKPQIQPQTMQQPQVQAQPTIMNAQNNMPRMKGRSHLLLKLLIVLVIIVVLAGAGLFIANKYFNLSFTSFNLVKQSPETVINNMFNNVKNIKSGHTVSQIEIIATDKNKVVQADLSMSATSESDITDANNIKGNSAVTLNVTSPLSTSPIASINVNLATIGSVFYFKINSVTLPSSVSLSSRFDISQMTGKWFKVDQDSVKALSAAESGQLGSININQADATALTKKVQNLILAENIFTVDKQLADEVVGGQDTYHYAVKITNAKLKDLTTKIMDLQSQQITGSQGSTATTDNPSFVITMVESFINSFIDTVGDINVEMWIGKKDYMLYQVKVDKAIDLSTFAGLDTNLEIKFNTVNSNFNKPIIVQAPADSQKIEDIVLPLLKTQKITTDIEQIGFSATALYEANVSYYQLCKSGLLNGYLATYGTNLVAMHEDIVSQGAQKPVCFSGIQDYCVSTQLTDGTSLCIDKNGIVGTTKCVSYQTVCK